MGLLIEGCVKLARSLNWIEINKVLVEWYDQLPVRCILIVNIESDGVGIVLLDVIGVL